MAGTAAVVLLAACGSAGPSGQNGIGSRSHPGAASAACATRRSGQANRTQALPGTAWPERLLTAPAGITVTYASLVVDPARGSAYALIPRPGSHGHGPYRLTCIDLSTGLARKGPELRAAGLAFASGYLWACRQSGRAAIVLQISPRSMRVIRSIRLPGTEAPAYAAMHVTAGPGGSVWAGSARTGRAGTLYRLNTRTGHILATARLPAGTAAYDLSADPSRSILYVSAARLVRGGPEGNLVLEYDARSGRLLARADHGLVTYSVAGSALTAVPGGVWVSFRTGMLGLTLHLRQAGLVLTAPTSPDVVRSPATGLFHWAMYASTGYGGGALWLANQGGWLACLDPVTGRPRAAEKLSQARLIYQLFAADPARHRVYGADARGLLAITPPAACWSR